MIRDWVLPGLLETGAINERLWAVQDGLVNFFVVRAPEGLVCVDAGWRPRSVLHGFRALGLDVRQVAAVLLTHTHWDHARCCDLYPNARVFVGGGTGEGTIAGESEGEGAGEWAARGEATRPPSRPRARVRDGQALTIAGLAVRVIGTPGHTPDSVCYEVEGRWLFVGDALRLRRGQAAPFPAGHRDEREAVRRSIRKLARLEGLECLLSAHTGLTRDLAGAFQPWRGAAPLQ